MDPASTPESTDVPPPAPPTRPPGSVIGALAKAAQCDRKTVAKRIREERTRPNVGARIDAAIVKMAKDPAVKGALREAAAAAEARIAAAARARETAHDAHDVLRGREADPRPEVN